MIQSTAEPTPLRVVPDWDDAQAIQLTELQLRSWYALAILSPVAYAAFTLLLDGYANDLPEGGKTLHIDQHIQKWAVLKEGSTDDNPKVKQLTRSAVFSAIEKLENADLATTGPVSIQLAIF